MVYGRCKFHMPYFNSSLVMSIKETAEYRFCAIFIFYVLQKYYLPKSYMYFEDILPHGIWRPYIYWSWYSVFLSSSCVSHVGISVWRRMNIIKVEWPSYAWCAYQVSLDSVSWFRRFLGERCKSRVSRRWWISYVIIILLWSYILSILEVSEFYIKNKFSEEFMAPNFHLHCVWWG